MPAPKNITGGILDPNLKAGHETFAQIAVAPNIPDAEGNEPAPMMPDAADVCDASPEKQILDGLEHGTDPTALLDMVGKLRSRDTLPIGTDAATADAAVTFANSEAYVSKRSLRLAPDGSMTIALTNRDGIARKVDIRQLTDRSKVGAAGVAELGLLQDGRRRRSGRPAREHDGAEGRHDQARGRRVLAVGRRPDRRRPGRHGDRPRPRPAAAEPRTRPRPGQAAARGARQERRPVGDARQQRRGRAPAPERRRAEQLGARSTSSCPAGRRTTRPAGTAARAGARTGRRRRGRPRHRLGHAHARQRCRPDRPERSRRGGSAGGHHDPAARGLHERDLPRADRRRRAPRPRSRACRCR